MRKDLTKKNLKEKKHYQGSMVSINIAKFLIENEKKESMISYDKIEFINIFNSDKTSLNIKNSMYLGLKHKNEIKILKGKEFNMVYCGFASSTKNKSIFNYPFWIGEKEISFGFYFLVNGSCPYHYANEKIPNNIFEVPIHYVTYYDAILFCNKLSQLQGYKPYYEIEIKKGTKIGKGGILHQNIEQAKIKILGGNGYRLPLKKEWECAAKAGTNNKWSGCNDATLVDLYAQYGKEADDLYSLNTIASKKPNEWGIYDMSGNIEEWCHQEKKIEPNKAFDSCAVAKGGNMQSKVENIAISSTTTPSPDYAANWRGFRVARSLC